MPFLGQQKLTYWHERLYIEKGTVLLACSGEFSRAEQEDSTDAALRRQLTAGRLAVRARIKQVLWLSVASADLRVLNLPSREPHLDHLTLFDDLHFHSTLIWRVSIFLLYGIFSLTWDKESVH